MGCIASTRCGCFARDDPTGHRGLVRADAYIMIGPEALIVIWEASDRICGKRRRLLVPILAEAMQRHGHLQLAPEDRTARLAMSAATIDLVLRDVRRGGRWEKEHHNTPHSAAIRRSVPVRTSLTERSATRGRRGGSSWRIAHSHTKDRYVQTLTLTEITTDRPTRAAAGQSKGF